MSLFPLIQPQISVQENSLPLYREVQWNYEENIPIFSRGSPVLITGVDAVMVWAWRALQTVRFRYELYSYHYGNEMETLLGQNFTEELKISEAARYIKECLLVNPYITSVDNVQVNFENDKMTIDCSVQTVYGEFRLEGYHV